MLDFIARALGKKNQQDIGLLSKLGNSPRSISDSVSEKDVNIKDFGATESATDISSYLQMAATMIVKGDVYIPKGTFQLTKPVVFNNHIRLKGQGNGVTKIKVNADINAITFTGGTTAGIDSYIGNSTLGIEGMTIEGLDANTKPLVSVIFVGRYRFVDVIFSHNGGGGLYLRSTQDAVILDCHIRYCGNKTAGTYAIFMDDYSVDPTATDQMNVNDIKFIGCTFEHNTGGLFRSMGANNNSTTFTSCKFEYNGASGDPIPISLEKVERFAFIECRFTGYDITGMIEIKNSYGVNISGLCYNNAEPTFFVSIIDSKDITIRTNGRKVGKIKKSGNVFNIDEKINEQEHVGRFYNYIMSSHSEYDSINLRNIHYPDGGAVIMDDATGTDGCMIRQATQNKQILFMNINKGAIAKNGMTVWVRINASVAASLPIYLQPTFGSGTLLQNLSVAVGEAWYRVSIPKSKLPALTAMVMLTPATFTGTIDVKQIYYENKYYAAAAPTADSWVVGEEVYNNAPASAAYEKWICTAAGTPGTWKGVNTIQ